MKYRHYFLLLTGLFLSGCLSPINNEPPASYVLNPSPRIAQAASRNPSVILVLPPDVRPIYNTTRMAYTKKPYQVQYFSENQWAETPSQLLQPLIMQALVDTTHFRAVVAPPYVGAYQYLLTTQIVRFEQNFLQNPHAFQLVVHANINKVATNQLIASRDYTITVPLTQDSPYGGVVAANVATSRLLQELARFAIEKT